jgi:pSer/pThr/pTyr-binding forkhead associated (FHA) protein
MNEQKSIGNEMERIVIKHLTGSKAKQTEYFSLADFKEITFGRGHTVKVKYARNSDHLVVSRQHARITRDADNPGQFLLIDLKSRNGTFVNKSRISSPYQLHHGDLVQFGPGGPVFVFELDPPPTDSAKQSPMANEGIRPGSLENIISDVYRPTRQAELADLTGHQGNTVLLSIWRRHQPWIIIVCMLLVAASVIIGLLLLKHDEPIAAVASAPKTSTLPQPTNKTDIEAVPDTVRTERSARGLVVKPAPVPGQTSIPDKVGTSAVTALDSGGNRSVKKVSTGAQSRHKTQKKVETGSSSKHTTQKKVETSSSSKHTAQKKVETGSSSKHATQKNVETSASSKHKTQKKIKTRSSHPADDWKVIEHQ